MLWAEVEAESVVTLDMSWLGLRSWLQKLASRDGLPDSRVGFWTDCGQLRNGEAPETGPKERQNAARPSGSPSRNANHITFNTHHHVMNLSLALKKTILQAGLATGAEPKIGGTFVNFQIRRPPWGSSSV